MGSDELLQAAGDVYPSLVGAVSVDVVDDAAELTSFGDASLDFVIANHVLEHLEDPVGALTHWFRVLRSGGVLMVTLPDARHSFDGARARTTVDHVLRDHREGPRGSRPVHLAEYAQLVEGVAEDRIAERVHELDAARWSIHFHVWELETFLELLHALELPARLEVAQAIRPEFTVVLSKL